MNYWQERMANAQKAISTKTTKQIEKQLRKYYAAAAKRTIEDFESTYKNGKLNGEVKKYDENGQLIQQGIFKDGVQVK